MRHFHRKKVRTPSKCETRSAIIKFLTYFDPKNQMTRLNKQLASHKTIYDMVIKISTFDFLRIEHLTQVGDFSPSVDFGASVDHLIVLRSCLLLLNFLKEFNILSKSGLGIEIGQLHAEIYPIFHRKTNKITTFQKNQKISKIYIFTFFN